MILSTHYSCTQLYCYQAFRMHISLIFWIFLVSSFSFSASSSCFNMPRAFLDHSHYLSCRLSTSQCVTYFSEIHIPSSLLSLFPSTTFRVTQVFLLGLYSSTSAHNVLVNFLLLIFCSTNTVLSNDNSLNTVIVFIVISGNVSMPFCAT